VVDATIHLDEHPEAEFDIDVKPDGLCAIHIADQRGYRVTIWAKSDRVLELADLIHYSLRPLAEVAPCE